MTLTKLVRAINLLKIQQDLINHQHDLIALLKSERNDQQLHHTRELEGLVSAWLINIEQPELDLRDELVAMQQALAERTAVLEEHIL